MHLKQTYRNKALIKNPVYVRKKKNISKTALDREMRGEQLTPALAWDKKEIDYNIYNIYYYIHFSCSVGVYKN